MLVSEPLATGLVVGGSFLVGLVMAVGGTLLVNAGEVYSYLCVQTGVVVVGLALLVFNRRKWGGELEEGRLERHAYDVEY